MTDQEIRTMEMFKRLGVFNAAHADRFTPKSLALELFNAVSAAASELEEHAAAESAAGGSKRQNTAGKALAGEALRGKLEAIRRTARSMAFTTPGLEEKFRIPRGAGYQVLINTGRAFVLEALPLKDEFIRHEMPANFIEDLTGAISELEAAAGEQSASKGALKQAVASIDAAVERGLDAARRLDPIIRNKFANEPAVLAEWNGARHIRRGPRAQRDDNADSNTNPPPAP